MHIHIGLYACQDMHVGHCRPRLIAKGQRVRTHCVDGGGINYFIPMKEAVCLISDFTAVQHFFFPRAAQRAPDTKHRVICVWK